MGKATISEKEETTSQGFQTKTLSTSYAETNSRSNHWPLTKTMSEHEDQDQMEIHLKGGRFLKNLVTNVKGPAVSVVLVSWIIAIVMISLQHAYLAVAPLSMFIVMYLGVLGTRPH
jgi:hypothetical protein